MSAAELDDVCASCGIAEVDEIKLKKCAVCESVLYCSDKCERDHREQHEEECEKLAAKLRDEILFRQPMTSSVFSMFIFMNMLTNFICDQLSIIYHWRSGKWY